MTTDSNKPEILTRVENDIIATAIVTGLAAHGISASTTGSYTASFLAQAPGDVQVLVRHSDLARAKEAFDELQQEYTNIEWSQINIDQPD
jgi:hypothetical protein